MNVNESCKLNVLLRWLLNCEASPGRPRPTDQDARAAAADLADRANATLSAGFDARSVRDAWDNSPPQPLARPKRGGKR